MNWILVFAFVAVVVALFVGGAVLHPVLYGLLIAAIAVVPLWLASEAGGALADWLFGNRR